MISRKWNSLRLPSATFVVALLLLVLGGCTAQHKNAVSPAPTAGGGNTLAAGTSALVATLTPEGTNTSGSGTAHLTLNPDKQKICYVIHVTGIELPATGTHIHRGAKGVIGPIVVPLMAPNAQGVATGCATAPNDVIVAITQHPADYYVNVHNAKYPDGAVRGQLAPCSRSSGC